MAAAGPNTVSGNTVSNTELSEFFGALWVSGSEFSEFLSAHYLCVNANSPSFSQNSPSLPQNSVSSLFWNSTLETVFRPLPYYGGTSAERTSCSANVRHANAQPLLCNELVAFQWGNLLGPFSGDSGNFRQSWGSFLGDLGVGRGGQGPKLRVAHLKMNVLTQVLKFLMKHTPKSPEFWGSFAGPHKSVKGQTVL